MKTDRDVIYKALRSLNIIGVTEEPEANIYSEASDAYAVFHNSLLADIRDKYRPTMRYWSQDKVPDEIWVNVAIMFAGYLSDVLPVPASDRADAKQAAEEAKGMLSGQLARAKHLATRFPQMPTSRAWNRQTQYDWFRS